MSQSSESIGTREKNATIEHVTLDIKFGGQPSIIMGQKANIYAKLTYNKQRSFYLEVVKVYIKIYNFNKNIYIIIIVYELLIKV